MPEAGAYAVLVLATAAIAGALVGPVRALMTRGGVVDSPNHRSSHRVVTPRGGGVACLGAVAVGACVAAVAGLDVEWIALSSAALLGLLGVADDYLRLPALPRLGGQLLLGAATGWYLGGPVWAMVGAVVTVVLVNAVNFMDGINGITALTMAVWGGAVAVVGVSNAVDTLAVTGSLTAGAALGFLPWNAPSARIFLGDVGSYLFGGLAATGVIIAGTAAPSMRPALAAVVMATAPLTVYLVDVLATLVRRAMRGAPLLEAHREHVYQVLAARWGHHLPVSVTVAALGAVASVVAIASPLAVTLVVLPVLGILYLCVPVVLARRDRRQGPVREEGRR